MAKKKKKKKKNPISVDAISGAVRSQWIVAQLFSSGKMALEHHWV